MCLGSVCVYFALNICIKQRPVSSLHMLSYFSFYCFYH